jgi:hypothetical protein
MANALADFIGAAPKFDLVGPTVDDDIQRAIWRYGAEAVKDAVKRKTKAKRGRKPERDWVGLRDVIEADAKSWLAGNDPFKERSNYSIAKAFADQNRGQSHPATMQRIERKRKKSRIWMTLAIAEELSHEAHPHSVHIRALEALCEVYPKSQVILDRARSDIASYEAKSGAPPSPELSMKEIENFARNAVLTPNALLSATATNNRGLFGAPSVITPRGKD